jgi:pimeloyl-ACP methyl ester carboxylesterase
MTAYIPELLDQLEIEKTDVVGISMGGTQALQFTADNPGRVQRLILVNTFARLNLGDPRVWPYYLSRAILVYTRGLPAQAQTVARRIFPEPGQQALRDELVRQIVQAQPGAYRSAMRALARFNLQSRLGTITTPTLVVTGERDSTVPPPVQKRLAGGLCHVRQALIPGAGHAVSVEQPIEFNRILVDFLNAP